MILHQLDESQFYMKWRWRKSCNSCIQKKTHGDNIVQRRWANWISLLRVNLPTVSQTYIELDKFTAFTYRTWAWSLKLEVWRTNFWSWNTFDEIFFHAAVSYYDSRIGADKGTSRFTRLVILSDQRSTMQPHVSSWWIWIRKLLGFAMSLRYRYEKNCRETLYSQVSKNCYYVMQARRNDPNLD